MRKRLTIFAAAFLLCAGSVGAMAAGVPGKESADVLARYVGNPTRTELPVTEDTSSVMLPDGTQVEIEGIPTVAGTLVIFPVPATETEAWKWASGCLNKIGKPVHFFDIYFKDQNGSRINADGTTVTIDCPHCSEKPIVYSLTSDGQVKRLSSSARSVSVTFTTNGSSYYILAEQFTETETETERETEKATEKETEKQTEKVTEKETEKGTEKETEKQTEKVTEKESEKQTEKETEKQTEGSSGDLAGGTGSTGSGSNISSSANPPTGDESSLWQAGMSLLLSGLFFVVLFLRKKRANGKSANAEG